MGNGMKTLVAVCALAFMCGGCSTFFNASAPAPQGDQRYAVGTKQGMSAKAQVWLCPTDASEPVECDEVQVIEEGK